MGSLVAGKRQLHGQNLIFPDGKPGVCLTSAFYELLEFEQMTQP